MPRPSLLCGAGLDTGRAVSRRPTHTTAAANTASAAASTAGRRAADAARAGQQPGTFPAQQRPPGDPGAHRTRQAGLLRDLHRLSRRRPPRRTAGRPESPALARGVERPAGRADPANRPRQPRRARHAATAAPGRRRARGRGIHPQRARDVGPPGWTSGIAAAAAEYRHRRSRRRPGLLRGRSAARATRRPATCRALPPGFPMRRRCRRRGSRAAPWADAAAARGQVGARAQAGDGDRDAAVGREGQRPPGAHRSLHRHADARGRHVPELPADRRHAQVEIEDPLAGHKALRSVLTEKDIHDTTAYLVTLK